MHKAGRHVVALVIPCKANIASRPDVHAVQQLDVCFNTSSQVRSLIATHYNLAIGIWDTWLLDHHLITIIRRNCTLFRREKPNPAKSRLDDGSA
jgi:hypothetical protein